MKKKFVWLVIVLLGISVGFYYFQTKKPEIKYTAELLKRGDLAQTVSVTGEAVAQDEVNLDFKFSGRVKTLNANVGDRVKKGYLLGELETGSLGAQLRQAQEQVQAQKNNLYLMKRQDDFYKKEQLDGQRAQVKAAEAGVSAILAQFGDARLYSPIDGMVFKREAEVGEIVSAMEPVFVIGNQDNLVIEANIPESDILKIQVGQTAKIIFDAFPEGEDFFGKVIEIDPAATVIQDVVYYKVKLLMNKEDARVKPGMSADVDIQTGEKKNVLLAPLRAIKDENGKKYVDILTDEINQLSERREIVVGLEGDGGMIEIISGVKEDEKIITFTKSDQEIK